MPHTRRDFLASAGAAAAAGAVSPYAAYGLQRPARKPLRILILGGTGFLGPHCVEAALARGHKLTLFNRGSTEERTGHTWENHPEIERRYGNRDPEKPAREGGEDVPTGLTELSEGAWDGVIDTSGYWPRMVHASAGLLKDRVRQYLFISTVSVYKSNSEPGADATAELATMDDPTVEEFGAQFQNYGPGKALCEAAAEAEMPGRVTVLRPGLIVGPGDLLPRFTYWPVRMQDGGEVLAPGTSQDPIQIIDVRDLAEWMVRCLENGTTGVYDALGPEAGKLTMGSMLDGCRLAAQTDAKLTWVNDAFLEAHSVSAWGDLPVWVSPRGDGAGFHTRDISRSVKAGLEFRPVARTAADTLEWYNSLDAGDPLRRTMGWSREREAAVLAAWHEQHG